MIPHIEHEQKYLQHLEKAGVGKNDEVASSPESYASYIRSVSRSMGKPITPNLVSSPDQIEKIIRQVKDKPLLKTGRPPAKSTLEKWKTALAAYLEMCEKHNLR